LITKQKRLGALGIVYGDIGTSPLSAVKETLNPGPGEVKAENGVLVPVLASGHYQLAGNGYVIVFGRPWIS
jgi:hypothetical protein